TETIADQPNMRFIFSRALTEYTHGNACGIGMSDFATTRLVKAMDYQATVINCVTAGYPEGANIAVHFDTDREVLDTALGIIGSRDPHQARVMHIKNTLMLAEVEVSEACLKDLKPMTKFDVLKGPYDLTFDASGNLAAV